MSYNRATLLGRLGHDPSTKDTSGDNTVCTFSLATTERYTKNGEKQEDTTWHNCVAFGKLGAIIKQYCKKGDMILVSGRIDNQKHEKDGVTKYWSQVVCNEMRFAGGKPDATDSEEPQQSARVAGVNERAKAKPEDDELPF